MKLKNTLPPMGLLSGLVLALAAITLCGCQTTKTEEPETADTTVEEGVSTTTPTSLSGEAEETTAVEQTKKKKKKAKHTTNTTADVETTDGPGDAPPPTQQTHDKLEEMEDSLTPISAIPSMPKT